MERVYGAGNMLPHGDIQIYEFLVPSAFLRDQLLIIDDTHYCISFFIAPANHIIIEHLHARDMLRHRNEEGTLFLCSKESTKKKNERENKTDK